MTKRNRAIPKGNSGDREAPAVIRRYGGRLIYSSRDAEGILEVVEAHGVRSLHFGTSPRQSALALAEPDRLELAYVRAMLAALLFIPEPARALQLGLGGGSLARFVSANFPDCLVDAVERRAGVVAIAHEYFGLPKQPRLQISVAEAVEYTEAMARSVSAVYDVILVDAYDHQGMDSSINAEEFFRACACLLKPGGVLSINLWGTHSASLRHSLELLRCCFPGRAYRLPVPNKGNVIGLGLAGEGEQADLPSLMPSARTLEMRLGLELPYFLRNLKSL